MADAAVPPSDADWPDDAVEVGRVGGAWGVKGWIKVQPYAEQPDALFHARRWFLKPPEAAGAGVASPAGALPVLQVRLAREHNGMVVASSPQIADRDAAQALRGARVFVPRSGFPRTDPDEFYWVDLIGLEVVNREGQVLGTVSGLMETGAHAVLRVADAVAAPEAEERLIPFVAAYVDEVRLPERRIIVDWALDY